MKLLADDDDRDNGVKTSSNNAVKWTEIRFRGYKKYAQLS